MNIVDLEKLFDEMDDVMMRRIMQIKKSIDEIRESMDYNQIPLAMPIRKRYENEEGELPMTGQSLIDCMEALTGFLADYKKIKDTWNV